MPHDVAVPSDDKKRGFKQSVKVTIEDKEGQKHTLRLPLPYRPKGEMFAVAETFQGGSRLQLICEDGKRRMGRIPGKMRRRMWVRENDLLIIVPWSFQDSKADVKFRYTATQSANRRASNRSKTSGSCHDTCRNSKAARTPGGRMPRNSSNTAKSFLKDGGN